MTSYVFYLSRVAGENRTMLRLPDGGWAWIRIELYEGDIEEALNHAKPRRGEIVLNACLQWPKRKAEP